VLIITHDTYLAEATADRLWLVKDGRAAPYNGDLSDYTALVLAADRDQGAGRRASAAEARPPERAAPRTAGGGSSRPSYKLKLRVEQAEKAMEQARAKLELLDRELGDPDAFRHRADTEAKLKARAGLQDQLDAAEAEWLAAVEAMDAG
jgi:ATP-binding cassette subfamily F protein 3